MESITAVNAFTALGQPMRLDAFRLVIQNEPEGLLAGDISDALEVPASSLSPNLNRLVEAGLLCRQREGRAVRYRLDANGLRALLRYLLEDCCGGRRALCKPVLDAIAGLSRR